mmetsp:Transcript_30840/g.98347  ORF Transcript_30840/g.98347 Transcript_30840/m.98347 type:complete len:229 (+) Transcript_30840:87-773(+)
MGVLQVYWPVVFSVLTMLLMLFLDPARVTPFPPGLDLSGGQALRVLTSPVYFGHVLLLAAGLVWLAGFARRANLPAEEHGSMVWWLTNIFWFHTACDLCSGYWQVMPLLTELYAVMNPAHNAPRWAEARGHLDSCYVLELVLEVPLAAWAFWLYARRDPARHVVEAVAAAVQFAGTLIYYVPGLVKMESHCWLSWADRSCGAVWLVFPLLLLRRSLATARAKAAGKAE